jgi:ubiquitin-protein ligase
MFTGTFCYRYLGLLLVSYLIPAVLKLWTGKIWAKAKARVEQDLTKFREKGIPDDTKISLLSDSKRLEVHFVVEGLKITAYEGGVYSAELRVFHTYPRQAPQM